ncbi:MAG: alpha/beta hydrolase [Paracoccaceae bacterium]
MSFGSKTFCALASLTLLAFQPAQAELSVELLSGDIPFEDIDTLVAANAHDAAVAFDLLGLKVEGLAQEQAYSDAANTVLIQAQLAVRFPDLIDSDVPALHIDAAELFLEAGDTDSAITQLMAAVSALRERAANPDVLSGLLLQIADLEASRGQHDRADELREAARNIPPAGDAPTGTRSNDAGFVRVNVYYATDRALTGKTRPARMFGSGLASGLNYGIAEVTIPRTHTPGQFETPSVWKLEFTEDPAKHVMLQSVSPVDKDAFFGAMSQDLNDSGASDAFVFIHGYNVAFDKAAKRTAQLARDMNFQGLSVLYSWPSKGATIGYIPDTAVVRLSGRRLTNFLEDLVAISGATTIHLIAHSMGNRAMTDALELMALRRAPIQKPVFDQVIFAAPDVDQGLFAAMMPTIRPLARRLTLYASDKDRALEASRKLHGNRPRAGQGGDVALQNDAVDTIDMSSLGNDMLAHSYVSNEQSAILDLSMLFWLNLSPENRCGLIGTAADTLRQVWKYEKSECSNSNLLPFVSTLRNQGAVSKAAIKETLRRNFADADQLQELEPVLLGLAPN